MGISELQRRKSLFICARHQQVQSWAAWWEKDQHGKGLINTLPSLDLCSSGTSAMRHSKKGFSQKPSRSSSNKQNKTDHLPRYKHFIFPLEVSLVLIRKLSDKTHQKHQHFRRLRNNSIFVHIAWKYFNRQPTGCKDVTSLQLWITSSCCTSQRFTSKSPASTPAKLFTTCWMHFLPHRTFAKLCLGCFFLYCLFIGAQRSHMTYYAFITCHTVFSRQKFYLVTHILVLCGMLFSLLVGPEIQTILGSNHQPYDWRATPQKELPLTRP